MNWDDIRIFLSVTRAGQILAAARRLDLNHATVGRRLSALEEDIGAKLFERSPGGCELTEAGRVFRDHAEAMEAAMTAGRAEVGGRDVQLSGTVRVGAPDGFGTAFLAPRLWRFAEGHGDLTVQLVPVPRAFSLSRHEADIAITIERPATGRLVASKLTDYRLGFYASPAYLDAAGTPATLDDLGRHRLVGAVDDLLYSPQLAYHADLLHAWPSRFEVSSAIGQTEAVAAGAGIGILHRFLAKGRSDLKAILPAHKMERSYWLVYHESARDVRRVSAVADFIRAAVEEERSLFG
ncbi:LysR family transcriptional regulator [Jiella sp. MQZ9-1]|uniref:LysR family transcriptional regulator n=1 Tax=Jiella flava TaxID=2816857 RepID=A0A939FWY8_9HYPH|nr:LysR family transcriptional regulator [Jiella flava]MBO0661766.1 LysR family transcriptional regulator [Jiella flava]MCD2470407.1 LysR family transcriptional regulator [Jiella flava]